MLCLSTAMRTAFFSTEITVSKYLFRVGISWIVCIRKFVLHFTASIWPVCWIFQYSFRFCQIKMNTSGLIFELVRSFVRLSRLFDQLARLLFWSTRLFFWLRELSPFGLQLMCYIEPNLNIFEHKVCFLGPFWLSSITFGSY